MEYDDDRRGQPCHSIYTHIAVSPLASFGTLTVIFEWVTWENNVIMMWKLHLAVPTESDYSMRRDFRWKILKYPR